MDQLSTPELITVTSVAAAKVTDLLGEDSKPHAGLRGSSRAADAPASSTV